MELLAQLLAELGNEEIYKEWNVSLRSPSGGMFNGKTFNL
jgi:hypothetical protein